MDGNKIKATLARAMAAWLEHDAQSPQSGGGLQAFIDRLQADGLFIVSSATLAGENANARALLQARQEAHMKTLGELDAARKRISDLERLRDEIRENGNAWRALAIDYRGALESACSRSCDSCAYVMQPIRRMLAVGES